LIIRTSLNIQNGLFHLRIGNDGKTIYKEKKQGTNIYQRECGNTCWGTGDFEKARNLWETALSFSGYEFEYRLATVSLYIYMDK
jgi:hypothetical protein